MGAGRVRDWVLASGHTVPIAETSDKFQFLVEVIVSSRIPRDEAS